jgi:CheY-like chemotaxis protein
VNGFEALKIIELKTFEVILMDIMMPGMDGFETTFRIRELEKKTGKHTPIIAITATEDIKKCISSGMDDYISKPIQFGKFFSTIKKNLQNYQNIL